MSKTKSFTITKKEALPGSQYVIEGEISAEGLAVEKKRALDKFQQIVSIDGFRKGHIPEKNLIEHVGELAVTEEQASLALEKAYPEIVKEVGVAAIGQPLVSITKIATGQPMGFKIETAVAPDVTLPDYKKLAKKVMSKEEEEVVIDAATLEESIKEILTSVAHKNLHEVQGETEHHNHDFKDEDLPELTDELVKTLGKFENVEDFKTKLKSNLLNEKQVKAREKKRIDAMAAILAEINVEIPELLIDSELEKMVGQFKDSISSMNLSYEQYLEKIGKTDEDIRAEWRDEAKKRGTIQIVLNKISETEDIKPGKEELEHQVKELLTYYKEADPESMRYYVETMMTNEKVWKFLEEQK